MSETLTPSEIGAYFEALPAARRELVWLRCVRLLGAPIDDFDDNDPQLDEAFDRVVQGMWVQDSLDRLVQLGVLHRSIGEQGSIIYNSLPV